MIKDLLVSFKDNIKAKTTNPFFGTLIGVWIIHNYKFVYTIFNFRSSTGLDDRLTFIGTYLERDNFLPDLGWCILYALGVLLFTYIFLNISRIIVLFFEKIVSPNVFKLMDKGSVVLKDEYNDKKLEVERFQNRFEQEQRAKLQLQSDYDSLEERYKLLLSASSKLDTTEDSKKSKNEQDNSPTIKAQKLFQNFKIYLDNTELVKNFKKVSLIILKGEYVLENDIMDELLEHRFIEIVTRGGGNPTYSKYGLTQRGETFHEILNHMNEAGKVIVRPLDDMV